MGWWSLFSYDSGGKVGRSSSSSSSSPRGVRGQGGDDINILLGIEIPCLSSDKESEEFITHADDTPTAANAKTAAAAATSPSKSHRPVEMPADISAAGSNTDNDAQQHDHCCLRTAASTTGRRRIEIVDAPYVDRAVGVLENCAVATAGVDGEEEEVMGSTEVNEAATHQELEKCVVGATGNVRRCSSGGLSDAAAASVSAAIVEEEEDIRLVSYGAAAVERKLTRTTTAGGGFDGMSPPSSAAVEETAGSCFLGGSSSMVKGRETGQVEFQQEEKETRFLKRNSCRSKGTIAAVESAAKQHTPFQLNRYILLLLHVLYVFASARVLFGWPNLSNMLFRSGAFAWLCDDDTGNSALTGRSNSAARYLCRSQDNAVQLLFTVGIACSFCCSLLAGIVMDWRGPRFCAVAGQILNTLGWILLGVASKTCQTYIPGVLCLALGADAGYLPSLTVSNLFPGHEGLVVVIMSAAMSASFSIPTLMDISWKQHSASLSFKAICLLYAGLGTGLCAVVAFLLFPAKPYVSQEELDGLNTSPKNKQHAQQEVGGDKTTEMPVKNITGKASSPQKAQKEEINLENGSKHKTDTHTAGESKKCTTCNSTGFVDDQVNMACYSSSSTSAAWSRDALLVTGRIEKEDDTTSLVPESGQTQNEKQESVLEPENTCLVVVNHEEHMLAPNEHAVSSSSMSSVPFRQQLRSAYFICFFVYWPLNALFYNFYMTSAENMFNRDVNDLLGILGPLSMIPSVLLGKLADSYGVMSLVLFISCSAVGMYFFALLPAVWAYYVSAVFSCLYVSNFSGQMYAYMRDTFHSSNFGRVVGITSAAGGLLALLRIPLHDSFTVVVLKGNYRAVCGLMLGVTIFCLLLAIKLFFVKKRKNKAYEAYPCTVVEPQNGEHTEENIIAIGEVSTGQKQETAYDV